MVRAKGEAMKSFLGNATSGWQAPAAVVALAMLPAALFFWQAQGAAAEEAFVIPAPARDALLAASAPLQTAVLAGGCFWGIQAVFQHTQGVTNAVSGYAGGSADTAI